MSVLSLLEFIVIKQMVNLNLTVVELLEKVKKLTVIARPTVNQPTQVSTKAKTSEIQSRK